MLHNSLFQRELLRSMNKHPLVLRRRDVHRTVAPRPGATPPAGWLKLEGPWAVQPARSSAAERTLAADAEDFLKRIGVAVEARAAKQILLEVGSASSGFRCVVRPERIDIHAANPGALWAGWVHLENQMREAGGPFLPGGETLRDPAWDVQIAPPSWGANYAVPDFSPEYLGDDTFRSLAHAGADAMFVYGDFIVYATGTRFPEIEHPDAATHLKVLREATERALAYGIRLYHVSVSPKLPPDHALFKRLPDVRGALLETYGAPLHCLCSSHEEALGFHADVMGRLFKEVPEFGGLILIIGGESYYHCFMRSKGTPIGETNCPGCKGKDPEQVIGNLLKVTADAATAQRAEARILAWPYSAAYFWSKEVNQLELIDNLPEKVALLSEVEKEQTVIRGEVRKFLIDYSVDYEGHSDRIVSQALRCAKRNRDLFIKTETSHGIELLHFPYVPAITRSGNQWQSVRALRPRGVLQRWGFVGMFDSVAERMGWQARWDPNFAPDGSAMAIARQLIGDPWAAYVVQAWGHFDQAVHHIPTITTGGYYIGPAFLGPAHPLPVWRPIEAVPDIFKGVFYYQAEAEASFANKAAATRYNLVLTDNKAIGLPPEPVEAEFAKAAEAALLGHNVLQQLKPDTLPPPQREELIEQQAIGEYLYRCFRTTVNSLRFNRLRDGGAGRDDERMQAIAREERENARAAVKVYEAAPWLNHMLRIDIGMSDSLKMIEEKVRLLEGYLART